MSNVSHFPSLSAQELHDLWESNPSPEVRRLLWEIARLHNIARRAWQLLESDPTMERVQSMGIGIVARALRTELNEEWCVIDTIARQERLLNP